MTKMVPIKLNGKYDFILPDYRAARPEWHTGWEPERIEHMIANIKPADVIYEIGAEEGDMSGLFASKAGGIVLFEPNPLVWPNIRAIWEANKLKHPLGHWTGFAGATNNSVEPSKDRDGWPECAYGAMIGNHGFKQLNKEGDRLPTITLDSYMSRTGIKPDIITMDVEGSEYEVLKGSTDIMLNVKPLIYVSVHPEFLFEQYHEYSAHLWEFMRNHGYTNYDILAFDHEYHVVWWRADGRKPA